MSKFWTNQWTAYIIIFFSIAQLLDILLSWLTRVWQFSTLSWRSVVLSSRRYWIFSSMLVISWKKIIFKMTYLVLQSTCKIKLQNDTLLVTLKGMSQILIQLGDRLLVIVLWQRKSVWISFYHNIFNYWCQIKDSCNQSFISQKIIGHGTPQSDYNVMMCAIGLGWHTSILKMNFSNKIYTHCMMENAILF